MKNTQAYIQENKDRFLDELFELIRIPSISADPKYKGDMLNTAEWLKSKMESAGVDFARIDETAGHPIIYAEKMIDSNLPTVLVYGHYDVQPADPLELWDTPPFEPEVENRHSS